MKSSWDYKSEDLFVEKRKKITIIASHFNGDITQELVRSCEKTLREFGYSKSMVEILWTPGAWEIPQVGMKKAAVKALSEQVDALIGIGCVIKGETPHFDFVAGEANRGLGEVARIAPFPVIFGILTTNTWKEAWARAAEGEGNKGREFAVSALYMINLFRRKNL